MLNKYADFIFLCREGEKYIYSYTGGDKPKEMEFDSPQDAQNWIDAKRGERTDNGSEKVSADTP